MPDLPALCAQVAAQFARDVEDAEAGVVGAHVERVAGDPDVVHAAVLRLVERDRPRLGDVRDVDHLQPAVRAPCRRVLRALHAIRGKDLVGDEHVVLLPPRRMRAADEARAAIGLHIPVERVEVVLELRDHHRIGWRAAANAVAHVEDHEPVVPVRRVEQAVLHVDVVQRPPGIRTILGLPEADLPRMVRIVDVEHMQRAGAVVGDEDVLAVLRVLVDERRVHTGGDAVGELGDRLRVQRILERREHHPVLPVTCALAREDEELAIGRGHHVIHASRVGDDRVGDERAGRVRDVDRVQHIAATPRPEIRDLSVGVQPDLFGREA